MTARDPTPQPSHVLEQVMIGAMLHGAVPDVLALGLQARHLADDAHRLLFGAMSSLYAAGEPVDAIGVFVHLQGQGHAEAAGGLKYVNELALCVTGTGDALTAARGVLREAARRELRAIGNTAAAGGDLDTLAQQARAVLVGLDDQQPAQRAAPSIIGAREFLADFKPLQTIVDGLPVARGGIYALTGATGHGKTTLSAALQVALRTGRLFAGREVTQGSVLVLAGENPDDYAMHLLATAQQQGLTAADLSGADGGLFVVPGTFDVLGQLDHIERIVGRTIGDLIAVFVDTSAAFYGGDDENSNVAMKRHASILRELTMLPGRPTVFVLCHPTKTAMRDTLLPRGGGAFLAEIDGNLTVWKDAAGIVTLHYAGKIRGAGFDPIRFELVPVELEAHTDCRGRPIYSTAAKHLADDRAEAIEHKALDDENRVLVAMQRKPGGSIADIAMTAGMTTGGGVPQKSRVHRLLSTLEGSGLARKTRTGTWQLTGKGRSALDEVPV
jgi:AAA domain/DnaB-like helicase N terminal domain